MTNPDLTAATTPAPAENTSVWEDFIDIFYAPGEVFRRRQNGSWFIPMAVLTVAIVVITLATYGALRPVYDAEFDRSMELVMRQNPQFTPEMAQQGRGFAEMTGKFGMIVIFPIMIFIVGILTWIVGKLFGSRQTFNAAMVVAAYSQVPRVIGALVNGIQGLLMDPVSMTGMRSISVGPARFVEPDAVPTLLYAILMRLDLFTIWATVLIGIGLYVTGRMSKISAAAAATLVWLIAALPVVRQVSAMKG